jgi:ketosteroid isomerase-like protein
LTPQGGTEKKKETVRAVIDALSRQDPAGPDALLADDAAWTVCARDIPGAGSHEKKVVPERILPAVLAISETGEPRTENTRIVAEGDVVCVVCAEAVSHGRLLETIIASIREQDTTTQIMTVDSLGLWRKPGAARQSAARQSAVTGRGTDTPAVPLYSPWKTASTAPTSRSVSLSGSVGPGADRAAAPCGARSARAPA